MTEIENNIFDLQAANKGCQVELKDNWGWEAIKPPARLYMKSGNKIAVLHSNSSLQYVSPENLRMAS